MRASAVVVNYNSGDRLKHLLDRILDEVDAVVVVDNASTDRSENTAERHPNVILIRNGRNAGFAAAANLGAAHAEGEWLVFANPDTSPEHGVVRALTAGVPDDIGAVAPLQIGEGGRPLAETGGHDPSLPRFLAWAFLPSKFYGDLGPWLPKTLPARDFSPDWVSGAFVAIRREAFERVHGFDERFFLYWEDADLCKRLRTAGYRVICRPSVRVMHEVAQGDGTRRVEGQALALEPLLSRFQGWRRSAMWATLFLGFGIRALLRPGRRGAAARGAVGELLRSRRWA